MPWENDQSVARHGGVADCWNGPLQSACTIADALIGHTLNRIVTAVVSRESVSGIRAGRRSVVVNHRGPGDFEELNKHFRIGSAGKEGQVSVSGSQDDRIDIL